MAREATHALMAFEDDQIVEGLVWGMNSEQRLRFLRLTEDPFRLQMRSETEAESSPGHERPPMVLSTRVIAVVPASPPPSNQARILHPRPLFGRLCHANTRLSSLW